MVKPNDECKNENVENECEVRNVQNKNKIKK